MCRDAHKNMCCDAKHILLSQLPVPDARWSCNGRSVVNPFSDVKLKLLLEYMIVELGISDEPLQESYEEYSSWVTDSWLKSLWEKHKFNVLVEFADVPLEFPREGDQWLMKLFDTLGFNRDELRRLNRVCIHHQVLFLSCILGTLGKRLDSKYLKQRADAERWSKISFPNIRLIETSHFGQKLLSNWCQQKSNGLAWEVSA